MRAKPEMINETNFNIIVNLHPTDGTHLVLVIRRRAGKVYYFDSFGVDTPTLFLEEYIDVGSNERIQEYNESYCGAYCLYMIYLFDRKFTIEGALDFLVNQVKCPDGYKKCQCLGCKVGVEVEGNQGTCLACHQQSLFADDNVNDNQGTCFADGNNNQGTCLASHEHSLFADGNDNQGTCFADDKQESSLSEEDDIVWSKARDSPTKQRDKRCSQCGC